MSEPDKIRDWDVVVLDRGGVEVMRVPAVMGRGGWLSCDLAGLAAGEFTLRPVPRTEKRLDP